LTDVILYCGEKWRITNGIIRAYDGRDGRKLRSPTIREKRIARNIEYGSMVLILSTVLAHSLRFEQIHERTEINILKQSVN